MNPLTSVMTGLFTVLTLVAAYVLLCVQRIPPRYVLISELMTCYRSRSKGIKRKATAIMLAAIIVMWLSTVTHWIATLVAAANDYSAMQDILSRSVDQIKNAQNCLLSYTGSDAEFSCHPQPLLTESGDTEGYNINECTGTVSLMVNVGITACKRRSRHTYQGSAELGHDWRFDCVVAGMGALAEQPSRPRGVCDDDLAHHEYVSAPSSRICADVSSD